MPQQGSFYMPMQQQPPVRPPELNPAFAARAPDGSQRSDDMVQRAETAARQAFQELVQEQKHISVTKLTQRTLSALGVSSFEMLGFRMQDVPCLRNLALVEGKVNANIHSHVAAKRITTLYDLGCELAEEEGVSDFKDIGIGPLNLHPLVARYFSPPDEVLPLTAADVMQDLAEYVGDSEFNRIELDDFMAHLQKVRKAPTKRHLGVRIQSLG